MQIFTDVCHSSMTAFVFVTEEKKRELVVGQAHFHSLRSGFFSSLLERNITSSSSAIAFHHHHHHLMVGYEYLHLLCRQQQQSRQQ